MSKTKKQYIILIVVIVVMFLMIGILVFNYVTYREDYKVLVEENNSYDELSEKYDLLEKDYESLIKQELDEPEIKECNFINTLYYAGKVENYKTETAESVFAIFYYYQGVKPVFFEIETEDFNKYNFEIGKAYELDLRAYTADEHVTVEDYKGNIDVMNAEVTNKVGLDQIQEACR